MPAKASHSLFLGHGFLSLRIAGRSRDRSTKNNHSVALFADPIAAWVEEESGSRRRKGLTVGICKVNAERKSKVDDNTAKMQSIKWLGV